MKMHVTKITGALLALFGSLQMMSEQIKGLVSPEAYGWYTIIVGLAVIGLGAFRKGEGSFLNANKTWLTGVAIAVLGGVQQYSDIFNELLGPSAFTIFNIVIGAALAVLGFLNSASQAARQ